MEGLFVVSSYVFQYEDEVSGKAKEIFDAYKAKYGKVMGPQAQLGYIFGDLLVTGLQKTGRNLTVETMIAAIESIDGYQDPFGGPPVSFSAKDHQGVDTLTLVQVKNKRWVILKPGLSY